MTPGSAEWVVRSLRDWARAIQQGMALVTYRSHEAREAVIQRLTRELQQQGFSVSLLRCGAGFGSQRFVRDIAANGADVLLVLDPDRLLFGEKDDESPFWINFHRETITAHPGAQIWWMSPRGALRFGQQLPDLARFFLFREELDVEVELVEPNPDRQRPEPARAGNETRAEDLLNRALQAARVPQSDPARVWIELALPALGELLKLREVTRAVDLLNELASVIGPPENALRGAGEQPAEKRFEKEAIASAFHILSKTCAEMGRREEALGLAENAVRIYRELAGERPDEFLPDLAVSLNNLGSRLRNLGQREKAVERGEEALRIHRELAVKRPHVFLSDLALTLNNLAVSLRDLGRHDDALGRADEAVRIRRQLAREGRGTFSDLALSLNNLAISLSDLGLREEALNCVEEAVRIYRKLAADRPEAFLPDLALTLNNLAISLSDLGRREDAFASAEEAVRIRKGLANERPDAFLPDLAVSLNNLGIRLRDLGREEEAQERIEDAVRIRRQLATQRPEAFLPDLALSLTNLSISLSDRGRREEALERAEEAVAIYRTLARQRPGAFLPDLGLSLNNLAFSLGKLNRLAEALARAEEAVQIRQELARKRPDAFSPDLALSIGTLGTIQAASEPHEAVRNFHRAIELLTPFVLKAPSAHGRLIQDLVTGYLEAVAKTHQAQPDEALLAPLRSVVSGVVERAPVKRDLSAN